MPDRPLTRGTALGAGALALLAHRAVAADPRPDPRMTERTLGRPDARLVMPEWFSLTGTRCAHFALTILLEVKSRLIDTGRSRLMFLNSPLDRLAHAALAHLASLAGMPEAVVDTVLSDAASQSAILAAQQDPETRYGTDATPSFRFGTTTCARAIDRNTFYHQVELATP